MGRRGLTRERHQEGPLFSVRIASHGQKGVLFLSGKVLSVIHRARSDVSRPRRYHLILPQENLSSGKLFLFICFVGWEGLGTGTCHGNTPFCFVFLLAPSARACMSDGSLACGNLHRCDCCMSRGNIEVCDQSDGIDLSEQLDSLSVRKCSCAPVSVTLSGLEPYGRSSHSMAQCRSGPSCNSRVCLSFEDESRTAKDRCGELRSHRRWVKTGQLAAQDQLLVLIL